MWRRLSERARCGSELWSRAAGAAAVLVAPEAAVVRSDMWLLPHRADEAESDDGHVNRVGAVTSVRAGTTLVLRYRD